MYFIELSCFHQVILTFLSTFRLNEIICYNIHSSHYTSDMEEHTHNLCASVTIDINGYNKAF